jgi:hypothetical protein
MRHEFNYDESFLQQTILVLVDAIHLGRSQSCYYITRNIVIFSPAFSEDCESKSVLRSGLWNLDRLGVADIRLDRGWGFPVGCLGVDIVVARLLEREENWEG